MRIEHVVLDLVIVSGNVKRLQMVILHFICDMPIFKWII
ncbi:MAG: hypothetical protein FKGGLIKP_00302 [Sodalis sp. Fse]|nr:MAG: hypothetical protein FKGGLIKP_00302 [Sodalis sp. Fse]